MKLFSILAVGSAADRNVYIEKIKYLYIFKRDSRHLKCPLGDIYIILHNITVQRCSPGTSTGIDINGNEDRSNIDTCYPTKEAAFVAHCNNPKTDAAEMLIKIEKVSID